MEIYREAEVILRRISLQTGVPLSDLTSKSRLKTIMSAKHIAREALRKETKMSIPEIMLLTGSSTKNHRITRTNTNKITRHK